MVKRKNPIDKRIPLPANFLIRNTTEMFDSNSLLQKQMLHLAIKATYSIKDYDAEREFSQFSVERQLVPDDKINMVTSLMQSLQPTNAIDAALASQFIAAYINGMKELQNGHTKSAMSLLAFSQQTLDSLNRYRNKGMQQINVQYNVNQGQVVNIKGGGVK
jgi:hypothetical protein